MSHFYIPFLFLNTLGVPELLILGVLVLILFGPGKLPDVFKSLGEGVKQFKKAASDVTPPEIAPQEHPLPKN
ncbi:MAG: twin-arginine translocase TatA/TatE family subunit [Cyanobacteria bacterium]|nr:twin-arginine translocase TatA/TatE family subunit [Cyanobacteriota bacterium]